jgi:hypothetical protein
MTGQAGREVRRRGSWRRRGAAALLLLVVAFAAPARALQAPAPAAAQPPAGRTRYRITLRLDFDARSYDGTQRVVWVNRDERPASVVYFHLYPNMRAAGANGAAPAGAADDNDEPRLEVTRAEQSGQPLALAHEDGGATLRLTLREPVAAGASAEIEMSFRGSVPEVEADETSLPAHVIQQVGSALRHAPETRRARDLNFAARGVMLLGSFYPLLAARAGGEWRRRVEPTVGDVLFTDVADYTVAIETAGDVAVFTSGAAAGGGLRGGDSDGAGGKAAETRNFEGRNLRGFALVAGRGLRAGERAVGDLKVRAVFTAGHEKTGRRVLEVAAEAARVYTARFGPLPFAEITVTEAPLVAGLGSAEFGGLSVIASAFYVDFDAPAARALPEIVREQRASFEDSLEFAVAQGVAHQWWGAAVGADPAREPVLDEALANWSALLYVGEAHGPARERRAREDQLRGVYQLYRTFGGQDLPAARPSREYRNSFQYAAVVAAKGALMLASLRQLLGDEQFFRALRSFYEAHNLGLAEVSNLRAAFAAGAAPQRRRAVARLFERWLNERRGDQDIAPPNAQLAGDLGLPEGPRRRQQQQGAARDRNAFSRLGRFFWRQMTRIP